MEFVDFSHIDFWSSTDNFIKYENVKSEKIFGNHQNEAELTIAIPVYNRTTLLRQAVDSAIAQNTKHIYDIIVVDNASKNQEVRTIIESYPHDRIIYYRNESNLGMPGNWNRCYELAKTKWVTLLHDDDRFKDDYVEVVLNKLECYQDIGCLGVLHDDIDENGKILHESVAESGGVIPVTAKDFYCQITPIHIAGLLMNREKMLETGGFNEALYPSHDANLITKIGLKYGGINIRKNLCDYRIAANESLKHKTLFGIMCYQYKHVNSLFERQCVKLPRWLHSIHVNIIMTNTENAIMNYWKQTLDYSEIRKFLGYRRANILEKIVHRVAIEFVNGDK